MYNLFLTADDMDTISFLQTKYWWASTLAEHCDQGNNEIPEHIAWEIQGNFELDTEGGHSYFPCLDHRSELAGKLFRFMSEIV